MTRKSFAAQLMFLLTVISCEERQGRVAQWPYGVKYEVFVRSFADGNGDGIGDLKGLTARLDYFEDLGVNGLWLMPVMKSSSYHKYDVVDYKDIDPEYGTREDFRKLVEEAHHRGIRIIVDLAMNHTSRNHPWFQSALSGMNSPYRNYYVWARKEAVLEQIAKKTTTTDSDNITQWHEVKDNPADELYYGFFSDRMPDLNFDNPRLKDEFTDIGKFWLTEMDVDGFRLDAARYIFPLDRATDTHAFWVWFKTEMKKIKSDVYLVGEVWDTAAGAAPFLKGLPALFNFDLSSAISAAVKEGKDTAGLIAKFDEINALYRKTTDQYLDAPFLRNHDQNRIMSDLGNDANKARVACGILLTLPGTPYIYYGEEIGMKGIKPDEFVREPFVWDYGHQDPMQTTWEQPRFSNDSTVVPLSRQKADLNSLFSFYKSLIRFRNSSRVLSEGSLEAIPLKMHEVIGWVRTFGAERLLVLHNIADVEITLKMDGALAVFAKIVFDFNGTTGLNENELTLPAHTLVILK